jgi:hypothetical protein
MQMVVIENGYPLTTIFVAATPYATVSDQISL